MVYVNPRLTDNKIRSLYDEQYFQGKGFDKSVNYYREFTERPAQEIKECKLRLEEIRKYKSQGKLLDVGCAFGLFLEVTKEQGWEPYGLEISSYAGNYAKQKFGSNVLIGVLNKDVFYDDYFDVITMIEVIEHFPNPIQTLKQVYRVLKKDGIIYIQTGNIESFKAKIAGKRWNYLTLPGHIYYFSPITIKKCLEKAGFKVLRIIPPSSHDKSRLLTLLRWVGKKINLEQPFNNFIYPLVYRLVTMREFLRSQGLKVIACKE